MGFCLYNNVAVGAAHARAHGAAKSRIVDYDVHHGNGTQHMFRSRSARALSSRHTSTRIYPGPARPTRSDAEPGAGFTVNLPIEAGAVDEDFDSASSEVVVPVLRQFEPELVMVSAGFDAHERRPAGGMRLTPGSSRR